MLCATGSGAASARTARPAVAKPTQELVALFSPHQALSKPAAGSARLGLVQARRPITEAWTVLPVLGHSDRSRRVRWLRVRLPGRPNGRTGWINRRATRSYRTSWRLVVNTSSRQVTAYRYNRRARVFKAVVGKASTPTPQASSSSRNRSSCPPRRRGAVRARLERPLERVAGVRRRPGPDRPARPDERRRHARHGGLPRLRAPGHRSDTLAGSPYRPRCTGNDHSVSRGEAAGTP